MLKKVLPILFILLFGLSTSVRDVTCSRKFLTGLIIGTLLSRNGMQGPVYPIPAPSYSGGSHGPQQPLFIIIPSGGGKPSYRSAQHTPIYSAPPTSYGEDYGQHHSHEAARSSRRISLARRLGGRMCRRRRQRKALGPPGPPVDSHSMNDPMSLRLGLSKQIRPLSKAQSNKVQIHDRQGYNVSTRYQC